MADIQQREREMNQLIQEGKVLEAFDKFTAEDVVMIEPHQEPVRGKSANRDREEQFFGSVEAVNGVALHASSVGDQSSFSEWSLDLTFKDGNRSQWRQVERRQWNDEGLIEEIRFFYNPDNQ